MSEQMPNPPELPIPSEVDARFADDGADESTLIPLAQTMVGQLVAAARWNQEQLRKLDMTVRAQDKTTSRLRRVIAALVILFAATGSIAGYLLYANVTHPLANQIQAEQAAQAQQQARQRQASYQSCLSGNEARATNADIWTSFIDLLLQGNKNPQAQAEGKGFIAQVQEHEKAQDCAALYGVPPKG